MERRIRARRFDCPLIFHRVSKGRSGQPVKDFRRMWSKALKDANLPSGRLFHDLRRHAGSRIMPGRSQRARVPPF
jgi:integrase